MMGLGRYPDFSLEEAREKATEFRKLLKEGKDPINECDSRMVIEYLACKKLLTFDECAGAYIEANRAGWKNDQHASQWETHSRHLRQSDHRQAAHCGNRYRSGAEGTRKDMDHEARNSKPPMRAVRCSTSAADSWPTGQPTAIR